MNRLRTIAVTMLAIFATWTPPTLFLGASTVAMTGCSTATLTADAQDIAAVAKQIAAAIASDVPTVASDLTTAANDLAALASALASGTTTQEKVIAAVAVVDQILGGIPNTAAQKIAQFLPIAVGAILALYNAFGHPAPTANVVSVARASASIQPALIPRKFLSNPAKDFKAAWNERVKQFPAAGFKAL